MSRNPIATIYESVKLRLEKLSAAERFSFLVAYQRIEFEGDKMISDLREVLSEVSSRPRARVFQND
ncbi:hypothetical protein A3753_04365 [Sulfitobacter sp. HI0082]|nr:hypothetical protein A3753_04365 [Sulfitobacter sp. HI0082]